MDSSIEVIEIKDEVIESVDVPNQDRTNSANDIKVKKEVIDSSDFEVIEVEDENFELVEIPIQNEVKFVNEVEPNKDLKDVFDVKNIINEVVDQLEIFDVEKSFCATCQVKVTVGTMAAHVNGKDHNRKLQYQGTSVSAYCTLCQSFLCLKDVEKHLSGKKHYKKLKAQEKSTMPQMNPTDFIITDPTQMPYYCAICLVSCACQIDYDKHLVGMKHIFKASPKEKSTMPQRDSSTVTITDSNPSSNYCPLCQISCSSQNDLEKHLTGMKHTFKANTEKAG